MCQVLAHSVTDVTMWTKSHPLAGPYDTPSRSSITGDAENARHEIAGHENAAPECKGGKCET